MKRTIAMLLAIMMVVTAIPQTATTVKGEDLNGSDLIVNLESESESVVTDTASDTTDKALKSEDEVEEDVVVKKDEDNKETLSGVNETTEEVTTGEEIEVTGTAVSDEEETIEVEDEKSNIDLEEEDDDKNLLSEENELDFEASPMEGYDYENAFWFNFHLKNSVELKDDEAVFVCYEIDGKGTQLAGTSSNRTKVTKEVEIWDTSYGSADVHLEEAFDLQRIFAKFIPKGESKPASVKIYVKKVQKTDTGELNKWGEPIYNYKVLSESDPQTFGITVKAGPRFIFDPNGGEFNVKYFDTAAKKTISYYSSIYNNPKAPISLLKHAEGGYNLEGYIYKDSYSGDSWYNYAEEAFIIPISKDNDKTFDHWSIVSPSDPDFEAQENDLLYNNNMYSDGWDDDITVYAVYKEPKSITFKVLGHQFDFSEFDPSYDYGMPGYKDFVNIIKTKNDKEDLTVRRDASYDMQSYSSMLRLYNDYAKGEAFECWAVELTDDERAEYEVLYYDDDLSKIEVEIDGKTYVKLVDNSATSFVKTWLFENVKDRDLEFYPVFSPGAKFIEISPGIGSFDWDVVSHTDYYTKKPIECKDPNYYISFKKYPKGKDEDGNSISAFYDNTFYNFYGQGYGGFPNNMCSWGHFSGAHWEGVTPPSDAYCFTGWALYADGNLVDEAANSHNAYMNWFKTDSVLYNYLEPEERSYDYYVYYPKVNIKIEAQFQKIGMVSFHSENFDEEKLADVKKNYATAEISEGKDVIGFQYKKNTNGTYQAVMPDIYEIMPAKEGYEFAGWYQKDENGKFDFSGGFRGRQNSFATNAQIDYYPLWLPKLYVDYIENDDDSITFNIKGENVNIAEMGDIPDNFGFGVVYSIEAMNTNIKLVEEETPERTYIGEDKHSRKFGVISLADIAADNGINKTFKLFASDIDVSQDISCFFAYGAYNVDFEDQRMLEASIYSERHPSNHTIAPDPKVIRIEANDDNIDVVARIGSKALLLNTALKPKENEKDEDEVDYFYYVVPHGSVVSFDVTAKDNCVIDGYKIENKSAGSWVTEKNAPLNKVASATFDFTVKTEKKVTIDSTAKMTVKLEKLDEGESKWTEINPVSGVYNVEDQAYYRVSYRAGANTETYLGNEDLSVVTKDEVAVTGEWDKDIDDGSEKSFCVDAQNDVSDYILILEDIDQKLSLHVLPGIKSVTIGGTKAVNGVQTATVDQDKKYVFPLTVAAVSGKIASNTLKATVYNYSIEEGHKGGLCTDGTIAEISSDMKNLYITTPAKGHVLWVEVTDTKNSNINSGFCLAVRTDASKLTASKVAVASTTDTDVTLTITNNQTLTQPINGEYAYVITAQEVKNALGEKGFNSNNPVAIVPIEKDATGKYIKTQDVAIIEQYEDGAVEGLTKNELPQVRYDVKVVQLDKKLDSIDPEDSINDSIIAESTAAAVKSATATPQPKAYATKITVAKKQTTLYNNATEGQSKVLIASASFANTVTEALLDEAKTEALAPAGVTIEVQGNDVYATIGNKEETPAGKYTITLQAVAEGKAIPAKATVDITVKEGELRYSLVPAATRIYKQAKKNGTLKVKAITPAGVKGNLKWSIEPTEDMDSAAQKRIAQYVKVANGTVTVDAKYTQPAEGVDTFVVKVEGPAYRNDIPEAEFATYTTAVTDSIEINTEAVKMGAVILVDDDNNVYQMTYDATTKKMVSFDISKGANNLRVKVLKNETSFKMGKFYDEDSEDEEYSDEYGYTKDDCIDESLYDLTIPKNFIAGTNPGTYKVNTIGSFTIKATANDGGKAVVSTSGKAIFKAFDSATVKSYSIFDVSKSKAVVDDDVYEVADNEIIVFNVDTIAGSTYLDSYNYEIKVEGGTKKTGSYFNDEGQKISYTGYQFKWDKNKKDFAPLKITVADKSSGKSVPVKTITVTNNKEMHVEAPAAANKLTGTQNGVIYSGAWDKSEKGDRKTEIKLKNVPGGTTGFYVTYDPAKLADAKYVAFWNAVESEGFEYSSSENDKTIAVKVADGAVLFDGSYTLYMTAENVTTDEEGNIITTPLSPATAVTIKVTKPAPIVGKYTPVKSVSLNLDEFMALDDIAVGGPEASVAGTYAPKNEVDTIKFLSLDIADATLNARANGFTDYFEVDEVTKVIKIKDKVYQEQLKEEIAGLDSSDEDEVKEALREAYKQSWKLNIPSTARNGFLTYKVQYGYYPDGTPGKVEEKTVAISVKFTQEYTFAKAEYLLDKYEFKISKAAYDATNKASKPTAVENEIKAQIRTALGDGFKSYTINYLKNFEVQYGTKIVPTFYKDNENGTVDFEIQIHGANDGKDSAGKLIYFDYSKEQIDIQTE